MRQPDRSGPKGKTLFELAEERQALLNKGRPFDDKHADGQVRDEDGNVLDDSAPIGPVGDAIFFTLTLAMLHFTLDVLVYHQYAQAVEWPPIFKRTLTMLPVLFVVTYSVRSELLARVPLLRQLVCLITGVSAGCYMIHIGNTYNYFAVMKQAPPIGTLWVWSVIEMGLPYALACVSVNAGYLWWKGYTMF